VSQADIMKIVFDKLNEETRRLSLIFSGKVSNTSLWHVFAQSWYFCNGNLLFCWNVGEKHLSQEVLVVFKMRN